MISKEVLREQFTRLINTYGRRNYPNERIMLLVEIVKETTNKDFVSLVDKMIKCCLRPPLEEEFHKYLSITREDNRLEEIRRHREEIASNYSKTPMHDLLKDASKVDGPKFDMKSLIEKIAKESLGFEVQWRDNHRKRMKEGYKPSFKLNDPEWNAQFFSK